MSDLANDPIFAVPFSTHAPATEPVKCGRPVCPTMIQPGENRHYMASSQPGVDARWLCDSCYSMYLERMRRTGTMLTVQRDSSGPTMPRAAVAPSVNVRAIASHVNLAQRQGAHTPQGRVTALPSISTPIFPVIAPPLHNFVSGSASTGTNAAPSGYTSAHQHYAASRQAWAASAAKGIRPPQALAAPNAGASRAGLGILPARITAAQQIRITAAVCYRNGKKTPGTTEIKEGLSVDYMIRPALLCIAVKEVLLPKLTELNPGFGWDLSQMSVYEARFTQDVMNADSSKPYFIGQYLVAQKSGAKTEGALIFKQPLRPPAFELVISKAHWDAHITHLLFADEQQHSDQPGDLASMSRPATPPNELSSTKRKEPPSPEKSKEPHPRDNRSHQSSKKVNLFLSSSERPSSSAISLSDTSPLASGSIRPSLPEIHSTSVPNSIVISEPSHIFEELSLENIRNGIRHVGGQSGISMIQKDLKGIRHETVICQPILSVPFVKLCAASSASESASHALIISPINYTGFLSYNISNDLGRGTFKTATRGSLKWNDPPAVGLTAPANHPLAVAMKRPFIETQGQTIKRFAVADETQKLLTEATLLGWAHSLMGYSYAFIDNFLRLNTSISPPFNVPRFRFVNAALAYVHPNAMPRASVGNSVSYIRTYLLEELLPVTEKSPFVKYIHNADAKPLLDKEDSNYSLSEFLCFLQHVQYQCTHGQNYISDFQGCGLLLTDPQIMTEPSIALVAQQDNDTTGVETRAQVRRELLFGEGNVETAFKEFPLQHECNHYCRWFKLHSLNVSTVETL